MVSNLNLLENRRRILLNTPHIETVSDTIASFKTDVPANLKGCKIHFTPIQEGEGDPSPENVRPIEGWDGVTVIHSGKNLLPDISYTNFWTTGWLNTSGGITPSNNPYITSDFMRVRSGDNYILQLYNDSDGGISNAWKCIGFYDKNKSFLTGQYYEKGIYSALTVSVPADANYMRVSFTNQNRKGFPDSHFQLEFGTEVTDYESYQSPTEITIPFPQTIYGGYVDLVKGEVVEEWKEWIEDGSRNVPCWPWSRNDEKTVVFALFNGLPNDVQRLITASKRKDLTLCESRKFEDINRTKQITIPDVYGLYSAYGLSYMVGYPDGLIGETKAELQTYLAEHPEKFVYKLATPIHHSIDPQTLKALRGMNNIWSDANGNIEVSFYTH